MRLSIFLLIVFALVLTPCLAQEKSAEEKAAINKLLANYHKNIYLIPEKLEGNWITVEFENPKCPKLDESAKVYEYSFDKNGFFCTSSKMYTDWVREEFYLVNEQGNRTRIVRSEKIFRPTTFAINDGICKIKGLTFFYGAKEKLNFNNPVAEDKGFLEKYRPECRQQPITKVKKSS